MRWIVAVMVVLLALVADAGTTRRRPIAAPPPPSGGGGWLAPPASGVEARAVELAALGVEVCSEPWNGPELGSPLGPGVINSGGHDFESSNNTYECFGRTNYWAWITERNWSMTTTAAWPNHGAESYVLLENAAGFFPGKKADLLPTGDITISYRYHVQFSKGNFDRTNVSCTANPDDTRRTKLMEAYWLNTPDNPATPLVDERSVNQFQFEEPQFAGCPYGVDHPYPFEAGWDSGPGSLTGDANRNVQPAIGVNDCDDKPCALEMRIRGDIRAGRHINIRVRATSLETGTVGEADVGTYDMAGVGTPTLTDLWGGDFFHSGTGEWVFSYGMYAIWPDANAEYWIGPAKELTPN